jgi:hypothetical protein
MDGGLDSECFIPLGRHLISVYIRERVVDSTLTYIQSFLCSGKPKMKCNVVNVTQVGAHLRQSQNYEIKVQRHLLTFDLL